MGLLGKANISDATSQLRTKITQQRNKITENLPQLNSVLPQNGVLPSSLRPDILKKLQSGKILKGQGLLSDGGLLARLREKGNLGILGQESAFRSISDTDIPTPGEKPGQSQAQGTYRSFS